MIPLSVWWSRKETLVYVGGCLVTAAIFMGTAGVEWLGSWKMALDWSSGTLIVIGPVSAGLVAHCYSSFTATAFFELAPQTRRGVRAWFTPAAMSWLLAMGVVLVVAALATSAAIVNGSAASPRQAIILVLSGAVLLAQVLIGVFVGTRFPGPWAPPVAAVLVFGLSTLSSAHVLPETFRTGGVTGSLVGQAYVPSTILAQAVLALGCGAVLLLATLVQVSPRVSRSLAGLSLLVAVAGAGSWIFGPVDDDRYEYVAAPIRCVGSGPEVCMARETPRPLESVAAAMARQAQPLLRAGVELPDRWVQEIPGTRHPRGAGVLIFFDSGEATAQANGDAIAMSLSLPADCPALRSSRPDVEALDAQGLLLDWIRAGGREGQTGDRAHDVWLGSDDAKLWVARTYAGLASCRLDQLDLPTILRDTRG